MSAEILDRHGSRLDIDSSPGEGSSFRFLLPLMDPLGIEPSAAPGRRQTPAGGG